MTERKKTKKITRETICSKCIKSSGGCPEKGLYEIEKMFYGEDKHLFNKRFSVKKVKECHYLVEHLLQSEGKNA